MDINFKVPPTATAIGGALKTLYTLDLEHLSKHPETPSLYKAGVRYQNGKTDWFSIPEVLEAGSGDCKDLACWRVAELRKQGIPATLGYSRKGKMWHVYVVLPNGTKEDPSRILGMGK